MGFRDRIEIVVDFVTSGASRSLGTLRQDMAQVDGATGKMRVAGQTALDGIKANAIGFATAAGAAIAGFAANAITHFQDLALSADAFATKTGLSADEASRLMEVAGDLGVPLDAVETSLGKMNLTADDTPGKFDELGAAIVRNKDGTINVKDTFLAVVDALNGIPDAATRAGAAQEIFGRGWSGMATLIALSADDLVTAMGNVSDAKVIDEEEVRKAEDLRDAMDDLKGKLEDATLEIGEALVPEWWAGCRFPLGDPAARLRERPLEGGETAGEQLSDRLPVRVGVGQVGAPQVDALKIGLGYDPVC